MNPNREYILGFISNTESTKTAMKIELRYNGTNFNPRLWSGVQASIDFSVYFRPYILGWLSAMQNRNLV